MGKQKGICSVLLLCLVMLPGCVKALPEMTKEQENQIVEYAANAIMDHVKDQGSRLVDLSLYEEKEEKPEDTAESEEDTGKMDETADTETIDIGEGGDFGTLDEVLVPGGVTVTYTGYEVVASYPEDNSGNPYFALDASEGKKLLVLQFTLQNTTEAELEVDIFSLSPKGTVTVDGTEKTNVLSTMLLNDMSTFIGNLAGGESLPLVLLAEIEDREADTVESLRLKMKTDTGTVTTSLQ